MLADFRNLQHKSASGIADQLTAIRKIRFDSKFDITDLKCHRKSQSMCSMQELSIFRLTSTVAMLLFAAVAVAAEDEDERGSLHEAQLMVSQAIELFDSEGAESAFERFNENPAPKFKHKDLYIFVLSANDATIVAHAGVPSIVGTDVRLLIDPNGLNIGNAILDGVSPSGAWVNYGSQTTVPGESIDKLSWVVRHEGFIFGCGVYRY